MSSLVSSRTTAASAVPGSGVSTRWRVWALAAICVAAAVLYAWGIGAGQFGNTYYSAAVKSMTDGFTNFLFGSFDPYGVFTVDKPPMSLWPQAISAMVFGYHGWALLLPQVLEGVAAVFLLHRTVRLWAGENAALLAALILALTPITVAINRVNNTDTLLVLLLVAAAYAFTRSVQAETSRARTTWLVWCAVFVGCGFLTKMLQAWIVVPAIALAYFAGTDGTVKRKIFDLLAAGVALIVSSFWWVALHDWWPGDKPYIGGSTDGSAWDLIFGYNGFGRVFGGDNNPAMGGGFPSGLAADLPPGLNLPSGLMGGFMGGETGLGRMFGDGVGDQISWLLPLSLLVLVVVAVAGVRRMRAKLPAEPAQRAGWLLWGGWLLVTMLVFSYAKGIWHPYYTTMLAPAIAAISGAGLVRFGRAYRDGTGKAWLLLPLAIALTAAWAFVLASQIPSWHGWARWAVLVVAAAAVAGLVISRISPSLRGSLRYPVVVASLVALLLVPGVWSAGTAVQASLSSAVPSAGPANSGFGPGMAGMAGIAEAMGLPTGQNAPPSGLGFPGANGMGNQSSGGLTDRQRRILDYAKQHGNGAAITLAVNSPAMASANYIIGTDDTVIGMGGFMGADNSPSVDQLAGWVAEGKLKFILSGGGMSAPIGGGAFGDMASRTQERQQWIDQHCTRVDPPAYGGSTGAASPSPFPMMGGDQTLYDCHA
jgi:4-amino-4-deoxy-L-arabinose transferase-like glycosyltransferase